MSTPQGMNEVLGPIYYVFAQHPDPQWKGVWIMAAACRCKSFKQVQIACMYHAVFGQL